MEPTNCEGSKNNDTETWMTLEEAEEWVLNNLKINDEYKGFFKVLQILRKKSEESKEEIKWVVERMKTIVKNLLLKLTTQGNKNRCSITINNLDVLARKICWKYEFLN